MILLFFQFLSNSVSNIFKEERRVEYCDLLRPNIIFCIIDITEVMPVVEEMISCFQSELGVLDENNNLDKEKMIELVGKSEGDTEVGWIYSL